MAAWASQTPGLPSSCGGHLLKAGQRGEGWATQRRNSLFVSQIYSRLVDSLFLTVNPCWPSLALVPKEGIPKFTSSPGGAVTPQIVIPHRRSSSTSIRDHLPSLRVEKSEADGGKVIDLWLEDVGADQHKGEEPVKEVFGSSTDPEVSCWLNRLNWSEWGGRHPQKRVYYQLQWHKINALAIFHNATMLEPDDVVNISMATTLSNKEWAYWKATPHQLSLKASDWSI